MTRRLLIAGAFLLLGVAVNVAVALACAAWSEPRYGWPRAKANQQQGMFTKSGLPMYTDPEEVVFGFGISWWLVDGDSAVRSSGVIAAVEVEAGWPYAGLRAQHVQTMQADLVVDGVSLHRRVKAQAVAAPPTFVIGWMGPPPGAPAAGALRVLPLRPLWPGFVCGALIYGALLWLLVRGPFVLRTVLRRTAWRCPACAYPVGVAPVCTECGRRLVPTGRLAFLAWEAALSTPVRRRRSRYALGALAALVVGAALNVAVAWCCAVASPEMPEASQVGPRSAIASADVRWWRATAPPQVSPAPPSGREDLALGPGKVCARIWQWPFVPHGAALRVRAGWPMPSMEHSRWLADVSRGGEMIFRDGLLVPAILPGMKDAVVPLRPVLPGALVNTVAHAIPIFLVATAIRAMRRRKGAAAERAGRLILQGPTP